MSDEKPMPKHRRSWLRRVLWFGFISLAVLLLAAGFGLNWALGHRVELANRFLKKAGPLTGHVGSVDFDRAGNIEMRDVELTEPVSGLKILRAPRLSAQVDWSAVASGKMKNIKIEQPEIMLDEKTLATLLNQPAAGTGGAFPTQGLHVGNIAIEKAALRFRQTDGTTVQIIASYHAKDVAVSADGQCSTGDQELLIEDGHLNAKEESAAPIVLKRLHVKGRIRDGFIELEHLTCDEPELRLKPGLLALFGKHGAASSPAAPSKSDEAAVAKSTAASASFPIKGVRITSIAVRGLGFSSTGFQSGNSSGLTLPDGSGTLSYEASGVEWPFDGALTTDTQKWHIDKLDLAAPDNSGHLRCKAADITIAVSGADHPWRVEKCDLDGLDVDWTEAFRKEFLPPSNNKKDPAAATSSAAPWSVKLDDVNLLNASVHIADPVLMDFALETKGALQVHDLTLDNSGWHSAQSQSLMVTEGRVVFPSADATKPNKPWFELPHGELVVCPDRWSKDMHVDKLVLMRPVLRLREGNTPWMKSDVSGQKPVADAKKSDASAPWWEQLDFAELLVKDGTTDVMTEDAKRLDAHATINITTEKLAEGVVHTLTAGGLKVWLPTLSEEPLPIVRGATITCVARVPQVWKDKVLEELSLRRANVQVGHALLKYFEPVAEPKTDGKLSDNASKQTDPAVAQQAVEPFFCRRLSVDDSFVSLEDVVPGMKSLHFGVEFEAENTPLTTEGLADNVHPQRIELANLRIPAPHNPLEHVAELDNIFVDFTLRGLFRKEIDKIEIVSPTLLLGQPLFEYVDFYRKYTAQGATPNAKEPHLAAMDKDMELGVANTVMDGEARASNAAWSIKTLQVHSGKLVIAPKGKPLRGLRTPFPFSFTTELKSGTMEADFEIPQGDYAVEDLKLRFEGLSGKVFFNLPMKARDNNVTEKFDVEHIRFQDLRTGKAYLSVTYDAAGIYGQFGADAYEGYIKGGFDVFLDDSFNWDLWINGDKVRTTELTSKLCPGYFFMDGKVGATLIAQGNMHELYQADVKYQNVTPGRISIKALNGLINELPKEWAGAKKQMSTIGLETLRDFAYDKSEASFRFYGREGSGNLKFHGPNGSRNFFINVYDHRWKTDPPPHVTERRADATP